MNEFWRKLLDIVGANSYVAMFADPTREILAIDNYTYTIENTAATPINFTTVREFNVPMDTDSDFVMTSISGGAVISGGSNVTLNPAILLQILDQSSGRNYFNIPTMMPNIAGYGGFPFLLTSPRVVKPHSTLTISAQAAQATVEFSTFQLCLSGARIFYR